MSPLEFTRTNKEAPMFMPTMFGLYFALIGIIAWDDFSAHS